MLSLTLPIQSDSNIRCSSKIFVLAVFTAAIGQGLPINSTRDALLNGFGPSNSTNAFEQLASFLRSEGATVSPSLRLSTGPVRGIAAGHNVSKGETLLVVPPQLILSGAMVTRNGAGCAVARLLAKCDDKASFNEEDCKVLLPGKHPGKSVVGLEQLAGKDLEIAAFLVQRLHNSKSRTGSGSENQDPWPVCKAGDFPSELIDLYLKTLPSYEDLQGLPVFSAMQPQCRKLLNGTWAAHIAEGTRAQWEKEWAVLVKRVPKMNRFTQDEFFYARALIQTRTFAMQEDGGQMEPVLVPLGDMLNEADRRDADQGVAWSDHNVSKRGFLLTSTQRAPSGNELFLTYGRKPNFIMYTTYGFFFDNHRMELVMLGLRPFPGEVSAAVAARVDILLKDVPSVVELFFEMADAQLPSILAFARAMAVADANATVASGWRPSKDSLPLALERRALDLLHGHVEAQVRMRSGENAVAMLGQPFKIATSSASCERYARLNNEPYGAVLDFAEEGRRFLDLRMNSTSSSSSASRSSPKSVGSPLRKKWASRFLYSFMKSSFLQVNPESNEAKTTRGTRKSKRAAFLGT